MSDLADCEATDGDERTTLTDDVAVGVLLPLTPELPLTPDLDNEPDPLEGNGLDAAGSDWPGFTATDIEEEHSVDTIAAACCDGEAMAILSAGRTAGPDFTNTPAVGGALYRLNCVGVRAGCMSTAVPQSDTGLQSTAACSFLILCWLSLCCSWR